jgi:hypothetical protein
MTTRAKIEALTNEYSRLPPDAHTVYSRANRDGYNQAIADVLAVLDSTAFREAADIEAETPITSPAGEVGEGTELQRLRDIVSRLPHTKDGVPVIGDGMILYCPRGHEKHIHRYAANLYCCQGECWDGGCQGDNGSGTAYSFSECVADLASLNISPAPAK